MVSVKQFNLKNKELYALFIHIIYDKAFLYFLHTEKITKYYEVL